MKMQSGGKGSVVSALVWIHDDRRGDIPLFPSPRVNEVGGGCRNFWDGVKRIPLFFPYQKGGIHFIHPTYKSINFLFIRNQKD
ncbi:MAG: hypothetical protein C4527_22835 [Candidatus Omnitrophota bacterium]|jgi:hypothetical protein|nr:MAG: hypothetical protein C4527_22835 [Candidatus Omnitrophota bacterium]